MESGELAALLGAAGAAGAAYAAIRGKGTEKELHASEALRLLVDELRVELDRCTTRRKEVEDAFEKMASGERYPW